MQKRPKKDIPLIGKITPTNTIARAIYRDEKVSEATKKLEAHEKACKFPYCKAQFTYESHCKIGKKLYDVWWGVSSKLTTKLTKEMERDLH